MIHRVAALFNFIALAMISGVAFAQDNPAQDARKPTQLGTINVTGSALPRADTETPAPVIVITAGDIKRSGLTTVADVVRAVSANNSGTIPTSFAGFAGGSAGVALRGLTVNSTLVLIDGRRVASYGLTDDGQRSFVDLNTIPLVAVNRIEVLKDGASSLYGADAIAGVVNIILKHDLHGLESTAEIGNSQHGGGFEENLSSSWGVGDLDTDRNNVYLAFEYQRNNRIRTSQRDFPFNTSDLSSIGGNNLLNGQPLITGGSVYGSVVSAILGTTGDLTTGVPIPGALYQPLRACGTDATFVNDPNNNFGAGAGSYCTQNLGLRGPPNLDDQPAQQRVGLYGRFTVRLGDYTEAYLNAGYYQNRVAFDAAPEQIQANTPHNTNNIALPPTLPDGSLNPNNPFAAQGQYALINYAFGDIPRRAQYLNHVVRLVAGIKGTLGDWNYDSALVFNHTWLKSEQFGLISYPQLIADVANGTYNFVDPSQNSPAARAALAPALRVTSTSDMDSIDARANRPLFQLPGGSLGLAIGVELRHEAQNAPDLNPHKLYQDYIVARTVGSRNVAAIYAELDAPVSNTLEVNISARYDHYSDFGGAFNPKVGIKWKPLDQIALRGTYSQGFRAPSFAENGSSASEGFITYTPPANFAATHNNDGYTAPYTFDIASSANPTIQPEHSSSITLGGIFQLTSWLNASLDYYAIKKTGVIVPSNPNLALANYFAGLPIPTGYSVIADAPDPLYPNALPRPIVVSAPYVNANSLRTDGLDLDARAKFDLGANSHLISHLTATKIFSWSMRFPDGTSQQYVGTQGPYILSSGAGTPRYRANWANTIIRGQLEATATIYYVSGIYLSAPDIVPGCFSANFATGANFPRNCRMASFTDVDLTGTWHYNDHIDYSAGVANALDRKPPLDPINYAAVNYNPTYAQAGIVGRLFTVGVHIKF